MAKKQLEEVTIVQNVRISIWQTVPGILFKRLFFQALASVMLVVYNQLVSQQIDWGAVKYALATQIVYVVMTFSRDVVDPHIPNSTNTVELGE